MDTFPELQGSIRELTLPEMEMVSGGLAAPQPSLVKEAETLLINLIEGALGVRTVFA